MEWFNDCYENKTWTSQEPVPCFYPEFIDKYGRVFHDDIKVADYITELGTGRKIYFDGRIEDGELNDSQ